MVHPTSISLNILRHLNDNNSTRHFLHGLLNILPLLPNSVSIPTSSLNCSFSVRRPSSSSARSSDDQTPRHVRSRVRVRARSPKATPVHGRESCRRTTTSFPKFALYLTITRLSIEWKRRLRKLSPYTGMNCVRFPPPRSAPPPPPLQANLSSATWLQ